MGDPVPGDPAPPGPRPDRRGALTSLKSFWLGVLLSLLALLLAFRQVELAGLGQAFARADYGLVAAAAAVHLVAVGAMASRWGLLFPRRPAWHRLVRALLVAHLANTVLPVRVSGMFVRAFLIGRDRDQGKVAVFTTVVAEKVLDSLALVLLSAAVLPVLAPGWLQWSSLRLSTAFLAALFPVMLLMAYRRERLLRWLRAAVGWLPWADSLGLVGRVEGGLAALSRLQGPRTVVCLWLWTLVTAGLGVLVNYVVLGALGIAAPLSAAVLVLVALQIGNRVVPVAPLAGIGVFQFICTESLALFGVDREVALSYGFVLHFAVFGPGVLLGAGALYLEHCSLRRLQKEATTESAVCEGARPAPPTVAERPEPAV